MRKNETVKLKIENIGMNGEGVARHEGMVVFVKGALPGEIVDAKIICVKSRYAYAIAEKTENVSPLRCEPRCPLFGKCGGCTLQNVKYEEQLRFKKSFVSDALHKVGADAVVNDPVPSDKRFRYRNKMSMPVTSSSKGNCVGLYALNSHRVIDCKDCLLQPEWNGVIIAALRRFMDESGLIGYNETDKKGEIRHLVVREVNNRLFVVVVAVKKIKLGAFADILGEVTSDFSLYLNINEKDNNVILGDKWIKICGDDDSACVCGFNVDVHPAGFFQVNDYIRDRIYSDVYAIIAAARSKTVIDAYSGAGIMTAMLSGAAKKAIGIEINAEATLSARKLIADNGISNMTALLGDVKTVLPTLGEEKENCAIVLDPPRSGCEKEVLETVIDFAPNTLVYVSCNPATLARDVKILSERYDVVSVAPYDMFPQTNHVETVVLLSKKA